MKKARCKKYFPFQNWWSLTYGQVYIYLIVSINLVSQITLRSSGTDILYGCHLLRSLYNILYFLWLYNEFFIILCNILKIAELDCCQYHNIKYICTIYTRLDTCLMFTSRFSLRDKVTLRLLKLYFNIADTRVVYGDGHKAKRLVLQCINGVSPIPVEGRTKIWQL